jgi:hypothetical protein
MNTFVIGAFALVGAVLVLGLAWGAPIFAVPLAILGVAVFGLTTFYRRVGDGSRLARFRSKRYGAGPRGEGIGRPGGAND